MNKNEMKLVIPQYISMTSSYSHKFVPENCGIDGHRFAPFDFFQSYNTQVPIEEATPERLKEESGKMYSLAKADVENRISELIKELKVALNAPVEGSLTSEDLDEVSVFIKMIADGNKKEDINEKIVAIKDKLNDRQLLFLRNLIKTL